VGGVGGGGERRGGVGEGGEVGGGVVADRRGGGDSGREAHTPRLISSSSPTPPFLSTPCPTLPTNPLLREGGRSPFSILSRHSGSNSGAFLGSVLALVAVYLGVCFSKS